jgi:hypothetical protein
VNANAQFTYLGIGDMAFFILAKLFPELENIPVPADC